MTATIVVRGSATAPAQPDRALLVFEVAHTAASPQEAMQQVAERSATLEALLRDRGVDPSERTTTGVTVAPAYEWRRDERAFLGHRAVNRVQVATRDQAVVGRLLSEAVDAVGARVGGPQWVVEPSNPAHREACRLAALDAVARATAYAAGLGLSLGPVLAVDETSTDPGRPAPMMMARAMAAPADEGAPLEVGSGDLDVAAEVRVTFSVLDGPAGAAG